MRVAALLVAFVALGIVWGSRGSAYVLAHRKEITCLHAITQRAYVQVAQTYTTCATPPPPSGTVVWAVGATASPGAWVTPGFGDGQCASPRPVVVGSDVTFPVVRDTAGTNGTSNCFRNMMNPVSPGNDAEGVYFLTGGLKYEWTFTTAVTLNGNYVYENGDMVPWPTPTPATGYAIDIPAIVFQTHDFGGSGNPCVMLAIENTYAASVNGITTWGSPTNGGQPMWGFHDGCDSGETDYTVPPAGHAYIASDTITDGQTDAWQIDMAPATYGGSGGSLIVRRNGTVVYNNPNAVVCDSSVSSPNCFWDFGGYFFFWQTTNKPVAIGPPASVPAFNSAGATIVFNNLKLVQLP